MSVPSCPNCGTGFPELRRSTRMFDCPSCGTTLFREADALAPVGENGEMHDAPMLARVGDRVEVEGTGFEIVGHVRFDYGRGWWDELWAIDAKGNGAWVSIDEGDVVIQRALPGDLWPSWADAPPVGASFRADNAEFTVTEADEAACAAFRGELPERFEIGERHAFVNASTEDGLLLSGEFWPGGRAWYLGRWIDPFELKVTRP